VRRQIVDTTIRVLLKLLCRVRAPGIDRVPLTGPLILAVNHINFLEIPLLYTLLRPRRVIGMAKLETWDIPALRVLANLWGAIPIERGAADTTAFRLALAELSRGGIIGIAPEGTRSRDGRLGKGNAGIITLAYRSGAPILPLVHHGGERVWDELKRGRRALVTVRVGRLINHGAEADSVPLTRDERRRRLDELMHAMASLLPPRYRGAYARSEAYNLAAALEEYRLKNPSEGRMIRRFTRLADHARAFSRSRRAGHFTASAFVVDPQRTHTLLVYHRKLGRWLQPGGHAEGEQDLPSVAAAELREETGLVQFVIESQRVFDIDRHRIPRAGSVPSHHHYDIRYLVVADKGRSISVSSESLDCRWVAIERIQDYTSEESLLRMVRKATADRSAAVETQERRKHGDG
jgi:1-acyl-sn-glycerol-3-phosphate acyltransferase